MQVLEPTPQSPEVNVKYAFQDDEKSLQETDKRLSTQVVSC
jgi:hypothetical protein